MAVHTYAEAIRRVLAHEGGYTNNPKDPGNWTGGKVGAGELKGTKYGIAAHAHPGVDIKNLTLDQAGAIYRTKYAAPVAYDQQPAGVDYAVLDASVNSGVGRARAWQAKVLGMPPAAATFLARQAEAAPDKAELVKRICAIRRSFLQGLRNPTFERGWMRRVAEVEAFGVKWALAAMNVPLPQARARLEQESKVADKEMKRDAGGAAVGTGGGGGGASQVEWSAIDWPTLLFFGALGAVVLVVVVILVRRANQHRERRLAYERAAKED